MKKKIVGSVILGVLAFALTFNINLNLQNESHLSMISLANLEALASETGGDGEASSKSYTCYSSLKGKGSSISCATCQMADGTPANSDKSQCTR